MCMHESPHVRTQQERGMLAKSLGVAFMLLGSLALAAECSQGPGWQSTGETHPDEARRAGYAVHVHANQMTLLKTKSRCLFILIINSIVHGVCACVCGFDIVCLMRKLGAIKNVSFFLWMRCCQNAPGAVDFKVPCAALVQRLRKRHHLFQKVWTRTLDCHRGKKVTVKYFEIPQT